MKKIFILLFVLAYSLSALKADTTNIFIYDHCLCTGTGTGISESKIKKELDFLLKEKLSENKFYKRYNKYDRRKNEFSIIDISNIFCINPYLNNHRLATKRQLVKLIQREIEKTSSK